MDINSSYFTFGYYICLSRSTLDFDASTSQNTYRHTLHIKFFLKKSNAFAGSKLPVSQGNQILAFVDRGTA